MARSHKFARHFRRNRTRYALAVATAAAAGLAALETQLPVLQDSLSPGAYVVLCATVPAIAALVRAAITALTAHVAEGAKK